MRVEDFFIEVPGADPWDVVQRTLNEDLITQAHAGRVPGRVDIEVAVPLARLVHDEFEERGTSNNTRLTNHQSRGAMAALRAVLARLSVPLDPPFTDFETFYQYWKREGASGSGGWAARRAILADLLNPVHDRLADIEAGTMVSTLVKPAGEVVRTGWTRVDDEIAELRRHFQAAQTPQDYRNVGNDCVNVLERLSEAAYDHTWHHSDDAPEPPTTNTKARLERVVEVDLPGSSNAELRKLVRSAIEHAQAVKHRTPDRLHAGVAADTVILLASMLRRITDERSSIATPPTPEPGRDLLP